MSPPPVELIVIANRAPYRHERRADGRLATLRSASGVVNAVEPLMLRRSGVWIAEGRGDADREAAADCDGVLVPPGAPRYRLRRVWLTDIERHGYYDGFANSALWPLCHRTSIEPVFYPTHFHAYELVNRRFADAASEEAKGRSPVVLVHDYHFALTPELIRRQLPLARIGMFWHIPWPKLETFALCPWSRALLHGLLGSTSIGFQTAVDRNHFLRAVEELVGAAIDHENGTITFRGREVSVGVFPASIDWPGAWASGPPVEGCRAAVRQELGLDPSTVLGVGVDRLDYTKGLEQKFLAIEWLLERRPDLAGRFQFAQLAEPTRPDLPAYRHTRARVLETAARVNARFSRNGRGPIRLIEGQHPPSTVALFFRAADFCYVGSLHDGMNLVSKEFVCARDDERGVLVLSAYAGAASELADALVVNPYELHAVASAIETAMAMPVREQRSRMRRMRAVVSRANAAQWAQDLLDDVMHLRPSSVRPERSALARALGEPISPPPLVPSDASAF